MNPTHCTLRARVQASSRNAAAEALDGCCDFQNLRDEDSAMIETSPGTWQVDVPFSYPGSENVAEGDLEVDIGPLFPGLMDAKTLHHVDYEFHLILGGKHPDTFQIRPHLITMIAVLGGTLFLHRDPAAASSANLP